MSGVTFQWPCAEQSTCWTSPNGCEASPKYLAEVCHWSLKRAAHVASPADSGYQSMSSTPPKAGSPRGENRIIINIIPLWNVLCFLFPINLCIWSSLLPYEAGLGVGVSVSLTAKVGTPGVCPTGNPRGRLASQQGTSFSTVLFAGAPRAPCKLQSPRKMWQFEIQPKSWGEKRWEREKKVQDKTQEEEQWSLKLGRGQVRNLIAASIRDRGDERQAPSRRWDRKSFEIQCSAHL